MRRSSLTVVIATTLALALTGCGGGDDKPETSDNTTPAPAGRSATAYTLAGAQDADDPFLTTVCTAVDGDACVRIAFSRVHDYGEVILETIRPVTEGLTARTLATGMAKYDAFDTVDVTDRGDTASYTIGQFATVVRDMGDDLFVVATSDTLPVAELESRVASAEKNDELDLALEWYLVGSGTVETGPDESYDYAIVTRSAAGAVEECMTKIFLPILSDLADPGCNPVLEDGVDFKVASEDHPLFWGYAPKGTTLIHVLGDGVDMTVEPSTATVNDYPTFVVNVAPSDDDLPAFHAFDDAGNQLGTYPDND